MATDGLTEASDALYGLVPEEFTAARNERAAEAKRTDPALAKRIAALRRPSPSAWIVNRLAREHADRLGDLVGLGGELADAQSSGDGRAMTALAAERRGAVGDLLRAAIAVADAADRSPSRAVLDEVEQTLIAATVSAEAGAAVRSGRLVRALQAVGFDVELDGAVAGEASVSAAPSRSKARGAASKRRADGAADADVREARERAEDARRTLDAATDRRDRAAELVERLRAERAELEQRLDALREELAEAEREARSATRAVDSAAADTERADEDAAAAAEELDRLG
jgi:hypothetical protein